MRLALVVLAAVLVRRVDDDPLRQLRGRKLTQGRADRIRLVVGGAAAAAQDHVAVGVALGVEDRRHAADVDAGERVVGTRGADRVDGDLDRAVGPVLEADRHREARRELSVDLALGRAGADRAVGDEVGDVLRGDRVEELAGDREPEIEDLAQQAARGVKALVDVAAAVQVRVVDEALPADRRARLLEVDAHRHAEVVAQLLRGRGQAPGVLASRLDVVDAAWPDDHQQAVVAAVEDVRDGGPARQNRLFLLGAERQVVEYLGRCDQLDDPPDSLIADAS